MATDRYEIVITQRGAQATAREIDGVGRAAQRSTTLLGFLRQALVAYASLRLADIFIKFADSLTLIQNRIKLATASGLEAAVVFDELVGVANRSRAAFTDTVDLYARMERSSRALGLSQRQVIDITEALNKTIAISGATTAEGTNALIQFGQALASNRLGGDELRSVMENLPALTNQLAQGLVGLIPGFKGTVGEFRELSKQGKLTADVLTQALLKQIPEINRLFEQTTPTIAQGFNRLLTAITVFATKANESTKFTETLSKGLVFLADNFDKVALAAGAALGAVLIPLLVRTVLAMNPVVKTIALIVGAFELLGITASEAGAGFNTFLANVGLADTAVGRFFVAVTEGGEKMRSFIDNAQLGAIGVVAAWKFATTKFSEAWGVAAEFFINVINSIIRAFEKFLTFFTDGFDFLTRKAASFHRALGNEGLAKAIEDTLLIKGVNLGRIENSYAGAAEKAGKTYSEVFLDEVRKARIEGRLTPGNAALVDRSTNVLSDADREGLRELDRFRREEESARRRAQENLARPRARNVVTPPDKNAEKAANILRSITAELNKQINLLGIIDPKERAILQKREEIEQKLISSGKFSRQQIDGLLAEDGALGKLIRKYEDLKELDKARVASFEAARGPARDYELALRGINKNLQEQIITEREAIMQRRDARISFLDTQKTLGAGFERFFLKLQREAEDVASQVENVLTKAFDAAGDAIADFAETGKFSIGSFFKDLQRDLIKGATRTLGADIAGIFGIGSRPQTSLLGSIFGSLTGGTQGELFNPGALTGAAGTAAASTSAATGLTAVATSATAAAAALQSLALGGQTGLLGGFGFEGIGGASASAGSAGTGGFWDDLFSGIGSLLGFQNGGSFTVGSQSSIADLPGADNRLVAFRARDGEEVNVSRAGESGSGDINISVNFHGVRDMNDFNQSQGQIMATLGAAVQRARKRNG